MVAFPTCRFNSALAQAQSQTQKNFPDNNAIVLNYNSQYPPCSILGHFGQKSNIISMFMLTTSTFLSSPLHQCLGSACPGVFCPEIQVLVQVQVRHTSSPSRPAACSPLTVQSKQACKNYNAGFLGFSCLSPGHVWSGNFPAGEMFFMSKVSRTFMYTRGCSHIMSANFGGFQTPHPSSSFVTFWLTPPSPFVILRQHLPDPPLLIRYYDKHFLT